MDLYTKKRSYINHLLLEVTLGKNQLQKNVIQISRYFVGRYGNVIILFIGC